MTMFDPDKPLWTPSQDRIKHALITDFMHRTGHTGKDYPALWQWSTRHAEDFWSAFWDWSDIIGDKGAITFKAGKKFEDGQFFPDASLNYAENILTRNDDAPAIIFEPEQGERRALTFREIRSEVSKWQQLFIAHGIKKGDRIAAVMPNVPETMIAMLACASLGAIWSSASPDFGTQGLLDRFGQIEPKILIAIDGYYYNGKWVDCSEKIAGICDQISSIQKTVPVAYNSDAQDLREYTAAPLQFTRVPFNHPLFILFSSGTTGAPKCIVHGHGGVTLQHFKEHRLQCDIKPDDRVFYFTTCGWMMWNWLASALGSGATLLLYDGNPFYPDGNRLWDMAAREKCTLFGTAAKYIDAMKAASLKPKETHDLSALKTLTSTGSPLVQESFSYVYTAIKQDLHLASISGGTDIVSCFMLGNPISPVWAGELQGAGLGMAVDVWRENNQPEETDTPGELVCTKPFPCMPVAFWNDPDGKKFHAAYFETFPGVWHHGDWVVKTKHGGFIILGRSDATLNPGGVRIGTAEIYRQVEQIPQVRESVAVGQDFNNDVRVILFVVLKDNQHLSEDLIKEIKSAIRSGASPRHVPAKIIAVKDIPRTRSGKISEIAVRDVINGKAVKNTEALANAEALKFYENLEELSQE